jgi:hypothetical protein
MTQEQLAAGTCSVSYVRLLEAGFTPSRGSDVIPKLVAALNDHDSAANGAVEKEGAGVARRTH